jgi:hypothetical protein
VTIEVEAIERICAKESIGCLSRVGNRLGDGLGPLDPLQDLTNTANAAIGTYSSTIPIYYADMQTLVERLGELRLGIETAPAPVAPGANEVTAGKGVIESKEVAPPPAPPEMSGVCGLEDSALA